MYILTYDIGSTAVKTCLFQVDHTITEVASSTAGYGLYEVEGGGMEQDPEEWWTAMAKTTSILMAADNVRGMGITASDIKGISFCSQMQGFVPVDKEGHALRRAMSYMDQRAGAELKEHLAFGPQIAGANIPLLLTCLKITGAVPSSVKDPVWKYKWMEKNEPELFSQMDKWLDVKEYLICRCTGEKVMTEDSAYAALLYDTKNKCWSKKLLQMFGVNEKHLPPIIKSTDKAGNLTEEAAQDLELLPGTPVFGGGGDASLIGLGAGCVDVGDTHIYSGTSGWVSTVVDHQMVDTSSMIAAIVGASDSSYNYFAEMETAGKTFEWVKDHLALDEIGVYLDQTDITRRTDLEKVYVSLYDYMTETVKDVPPGAGGVLFTPWLHGNRCPFEDPNATGMFFGITLSTGKTELIRAVLEGVCYHLRWMLECQDKKTKTSSVIRYVGGGALSPVGCQILADITGRTIEVVDHPQDAGAVGACACVAVGLSLFPELSSVAKAIPAKTTYTPNPSQSQKYEPYYKVFKQLHKSNKKNFAALNAVKGGGHDEK